MSFDTRHVTHSPPIRKFEFRLDLMLICMIMKFSLRQGHGKKKFEYSQCRIGERYFVEVEIYAPGSVVIKAWNRNHESCPSSVGERTGVERFHANLKKRRSVLFEASHRVRLAGSLACCECVCVFFQSR